MNIATIAAFWTVSMLFVLTPGADWAYAMAAGIRHTNVGWAVAGLLAASPTAMTVLTVAGSPPGRLADGDDRAHGGWQPSWPPRRRR